MKIIFNFNKVKAMALSSVGTTLDTNLQILFNSFDRDDIINLSEHIVTYLAKSIKDSTFDLDTRSNIYTYNQDIRTIITRYYSDEEVIVSIIDLIFMSIIHAINIFELYFINEQIEAYENAVVCRDLKKFIENTFYSKK